MGFSVLLRFLSWAVFASSAYASGLSSSDFRFRGCCASGPEVTLVAWSKTGTTAQLAGWVREGVESVQTVRADLIVVDLIRDEETRGRAAPLDQEPTKGPALPACTNGLAIGSPVHLANPHWRALQWIETELGPHWQNRTFQGVPAAVFASGGGMHQGLSETLATLARGLISFGFEIQAPDPSAGAFHGTGGASRVTALKESGVPPAGLVVMESAFRAAAKDLGMQLGKAAAVHHRAACHLGVATQ